MSDAICGKPVHGTFGAPCTFPPDHVQWWCQHDGTLMPVVSRPDEHDCEACEDCIHNGNKCCGCYDGVCCQERRTPPGQEPRR